MKIDKYWQRFCSLFAKDFNPILRKKFACEFMKDNKTYRMFLICEEFPQKDFPK